MAGLQSFFHELVYFQVELWDAIDARLQAECALPLTWFEIMDLLEQHSGSRVRDIAAAFSISVGGTSKVVDKLEAAGYCVRHPNPSDRRSSVIELTAQGRQALAAAMRVFENELEARIGSVVPRQRITELHETLVELRAAGRALPTPR
ncbi:MarR family transcriptional regulator [Glycomyces luteolus]|uniref:MarR family transcriptional regulator n=2 Tax=Glycomyces TaxID=58113 RepID=A0A9X3SSG2_9ACTN|nr:MULTISPECIES: MarR family transcriptional regulator [Glycomyces]MDA1362531.1 MarR family transcriptional regulator [Glycomyces luteolus]MDN3239132.1 MarR family transcriptional regulator [Glycomyces tritici]